MIMIARPLRLLICLIVTGFAFTSGGEIVAQESQLEQMLRRLDTGQDGDLDPNEMVGGIREWVERLGFDPNTYHRIDVLMEAYRNNGNAVERGPLVRKVPGFGNGNDGDMIDTPGFGANSAFVELSDEEMMEKYGEHYDAVMEQINRLMSQNDADENGILDPQEIEKTAWGQPLPYTSDINNDGSLSRTELGDRYYARERAKRSGRRSRRQNQENDENGEEGQEQNNDRQQRNRGGGQNFQAPVTRNRPANNTASSNNNQNDDGNRLETYVNEVFSKYDANGDSIIDADEMKAMRRAPSGADTDGDGNFSREELHGFYKRQQGDGDESSGDSNENASTGRVRGPRGSSRRRSGNLTDYDTNMDGQIQMHEFSSEWDAIILEQFNEKDQNGDGVITAEEWSGG